MCRPARRTGVSASPCLDAEVPLEGKSTSRNRPIVSARFRTCQKVSCLSDTAASEPSGSDLGEPPPSTEPEGRAQARAFP